MDPLEEQKLSQVLRTWETDVEVPRRFRASVWSQIAARQERRGPSIRERVGAFFSRPVYATATGALAIIASVTLAHQHAEHHLGRQRAIAENGYLETISPLARVSPDGSSYSSPHGHE